MLRHALARSTSALAGLVRFTTTPDEMLIGLVRGREAATTAAIVKPHCYCFGGSLESARWLERVREGSFKLNADGTRFTVTGCGSPISILPPRYSRIDLIDLSPRDSMSRSASFAVAA